MHLTSNGATVNVVHRDLDLNFQGHEFLIVNILIYQRISQTAIDSRTIPTGFQSGGWITMEFYLFPKIVLPFPPFRGETKNTHSQFSHKMFDSRFLCGL